MRLPGIRAYNLLTTLIESVIVDFNRIHYVFFHFLLIWYSIALMKLSKRDAVSSFYVFRLDDHFLIKIVSVISLTWTNMVRDDHPWHVWFWLNYCYLIIEKTNLDEVHLILKFKLNTIYSLLVINKLVWYCWNKECHPYHLC